MRPALLALALVLAPTVALAQQAEIAQAREMVTQSDGLVAAGQLEPAERLLRQALSIHTQRLGSGTAHLVPIFIRLARVRIRRGDAAEANALCERSMELTSWHRERMGSLTSEVLEVWAEVAQRSGDRATARQRLEQALATLDQTREAALAASLITRLAELDEEEGRLRSAADRFRQAGMIREARLGREHPSVAGSLNRLAAVLVRAGRGGTAGPLYARAERILEAAFGAEDPRLANVLDNHAQLLASEGQAARAEELATRALRIRRGAQAAGPEIARSLNTLGQIYRATSATDSVRRAVSTFERALQLLEAAPNADRALLADVLGNLGAARSALGQDAQAEPLHRRALEIRRALFGDEHPTVASSLFSLGAVYAHMNDEGRASEHWRRALEIRRRVLGDAHPATADCLNNLADLHALGGNFDEALREQRRALSIYVAAFGPAHPRVAAAHINLGRIYAAQNQTGLAVRHFFRGFDASETLLRSAGSGLGSARTDELLGARQGEEWAIYSLLLRGGAHQGAARLALAVAYLRKGRSLDTMADTSRALSRGLSDADRQRWEQARQIRAELAGLLLRGSGSEGREAHDARVGELQRQVGAIERDLSSRSAAVRAQASMPNPADVGGRIAQSLPRDSALVEVLAFEPYNFAARSMDSRWGELRYVAVVVSRDRAAQVVDLGLVSELNPLIRRFRAGLASRRDDVRRSGHALYQRAFAPLERALAGRTRVILSLDGELQMIPYAALHDGRHHLVERFEISYVTSGRDLVREREARALSSGGVTVVADPAFALPSSAEAPARRTAPFAIDPASISPLPGTRREASAVQAAFTGSQMFLGAQATEEAVTGLQAPSVLHVATHGVFLENEAQAFQASTRGLMVVSDSPTPSGAGATSPLVRSALLLAGARSGLSPESASDGFLTALELAGMDLWGTQLVVLSACDTGRGDIPLGQGVFGLRRATLIAGAETLVTSLWRIDDNVTEALMARFYRELRGGAGRAAAMRRASLAIREQNPHPFFWAPFVVIGDRGALAR